MRLPHLSRPLRTLAGGAFCLSILSGMIAGHAWPLWTGETVLLQARPVDPRDLFRGEFVRLDTPAARLFVPAGSQPAPSNAVAVRGLGAWAGGRTAGGTAHAVRGSTVYVQLERRQGSTVHEAVSISDAPVDDALNLRGRVRLIDPSGVAIVDYGLDAFYMQEGTATPIERALVEGRLVQMQVAVASSGRARIRTLVVDGVAVR